MCVLSSFSCVWLFGTLWTVTHQAPLSMGFSRQEYWSGLLCPPPGDLPNLGIEPRSLNLVLLHWRQILYFLSYQYHLDGNTPKLIYSFNAFPIESPSNLKKKIGKWILKCIYKCKRHRISKGVFKKNTVEGHTLFKISKLILKSQ